MLHSEKCNILYCECIHYKIELLYLKIVVIIYIPNGTNFFFKEKLNVIIFVNLNIHEKLLINYIVKKLVKITKMNFF